MTACLAQMRQHLAGTAVKRDVQPIGQPRNPDGSINYGYLDGGRWWDLPVGACTELQRGFVGNSRFASEVGERVIPRTNRNVTRKWLALGERKS